ncbi:MAG: hypothetical protein IJH77_04965, partial [Mogibacterium sp.]|nr:hypothetical protein [Mogibacterium sp.]
LYRYLSSLDRNTISRLYDLRSSHFREIAALNREELEKYSDTMKETIAEFLDSDRLVREWKKNYPGYIRPNVRIYTSKAGDLAREMSPFLKQYTENINLITSNVYHWLHSAEGAELLVRIESRLSGSYDLDHAAHGELEVMATMLW